jgi:hypothetical protein
LSGRLISTHKIIGSTNGNYALEFEKSLASGTYLIRIAGPEMTEDHLHVISK